MPALRRAADLTVGYFLGNGGAVLDGVGDFLNGLVAKGNLAWQWVYLQGVMAGRPRGETAVLVAALTSGSVAYLVALCVQVQMLVDRLMGEEALNG